MPSESFQTKILNDGRVEVRMGSESADTGPNDEVAVVSRRGGRFPNTIYRMDDGTIVLKQNRARDVFFYAADQTIPPGQLCSTCGSIDFRGLTRPECDPQDVGHIPVGSIRGIISRRDVCAFCRLLFLALTQLASSSRLSMLDVPKKPGSAICKLSVDPGLTYTDAHGNVVKSEKALKFVHPGTGLSTFGERPSQCLLPRLVNQLDDEDSSLNCSRIFDPDWISISLISAWLEKCEAWHEECKRQLEYSKPLPPLRAIDVKRQCLVQIPGGSKYIALSYCWGRVSAIKLTTANRQIWERDGALDSQSLHLPKTIRDSIILVQRIGLPYLWVDALCLIQDSLEDLHLFNAMGEIYSHAAFTIVAADGEDANTGLLGVFTVPRWGPRSHSEELLNTRKPAVQQTVEVLPQLRLSVALRGLQPGLNMSPWNQRAWTYQERMMSSRMLVFSEHQMFWVCRAETWSESRVLEHPRRKRWKNPGFMFKWADLDEGDTVDADNDRIPLYELKNHRTGGLHLYHETVVAFLDRILSYEGDVLNAFSGLLRLLSANLKSEIRFGLPIRHLNKTLLWCPREDERFKGSFPENLVRRGYGPGWQDYRPQYEDRAPFPSWSWAGWMGRITFPYFVSNDLIPMQGDEYLEELLNWYYFVREDEDIQAFLNNGTPVSFRSGDKLFQVLKLHWRQQHADHGKQTAVGESPNEICHAHDCTNININYVFQIDNEQFEINTSHDEQTWVQSHILKPDFRYLYFITTCAFIELGRYGIVSKTSLGYELLPPLSDHGPSEGLAGLSQIPSVGFVSLNSNERSFKMDRARHEFLVVSGMQKFNHEVSEELLKLKGAVSVASPVEPEEKTSRAQSTAGWIQFWNVLLVEWKDGVAYRIGVGRVLKAAWPLALPKWKLVTLG